MKFLINNYAYPGLVKALENEGHEVLGMNGTVDEFNWWQHLINDGKSNDEYDAILRAQIEEHRPDVYLCGKGWHFEKMIKPETVEWIRTKVGCTMYWSLDDPDFVPTFMRQEMWRGYDVVLTCCAGSIKDYESKGLDGHLMWPAWDQVNWKAVNVPEKDKVDFVIVGTPYTVTRPPRRDIAAGVIAADLDLEIYGSDAWLRSHPDHFAAGYPSLKANYKGMFLDWKNVPSLFAKARVNLSNHIREGYLYLNDRVPLVLGTGGFLIVDRIEGLSDVFIEDKHVVYYDDLADLVAKAKFYVEHQEERDRIAKVGQRFVLKHHTYENRAREILAILAARGMR